MAKRYQVKLRGEIPLLMRNDDIKHAERVKARAEERLSEGMVAEISVAKQLNIPIKYFDEQCERRHNANQY